MKNFSDWFDVFCVYFIMIFFVFGNVNSLVALIFVPIIGVMQYFKFVIPTNAIEPKNFKDIISSNIKPKKIGLWLFIFIQKKINFKMKKI